MRVSEEYCVICGIEVGTSKSTEYGDRTYYFCSSDCEEEFKRIPEDYI